MARKRPRPLLILLLALTVLVAGPAPLAAARGGGGTSKSALDRTWFGPEADLGVQQETVSINDAVVGTEDGRPAMYTTVSAENAIFNVIDIRDNRLLRSFTLPGVQQSWRHAIGPDGTVYIAAITGGQTGELWSYSPADKEVRKLGTVPGEKSLWSMTTDPEGNVWIGTFPNGKVFRYDPQSKDFHDYGQMVPGQQYVRSIAYHDGSVYAGVGSVGDVIRLDTATGTKTKISDQVPALLGVEPQKVPFAYDMTVVDGWLFVKFSDPQMKLLFYDLDAGKWSDKSVGKNTPSDAGVFSFNQLQSRDGKVYVTNNRELYEIDTATLESRSTGIAFGTSLRGAAWIPLNDPDLPGTSLVTLQSGGRITAFDIASRQSKALPSVVQGAPNPLHNLEAAPDGTLFMSGYPGGTGSRFDPRTGRTTRFPMGQAEGMAGLGDTMYFGIYPGGIISSAKLDAATPAVSEKFRLGSEQDRPYVMKAHDGKLLIGSIPDYGKLGGALTIYDPDDGGKKTYPDIVHNQSVAGLAQRGGRIYGSTTVYGGLGTDATESEAKMFVWDVAGERKVKEFALGLPGLDSPKMISGLGFGRDGLLWGAADGFLFAMDPGTLQVVKYKNVYPEVKHYGMWRPVYLRFGADGLLYTTLAGKLTVVDPKTMDHVTLGDYAEEVAFMTLARDADGHENIYFLGKTAESRLRMIPVRHGHARTVAVGNAGFEVAPLDDGAVPGWQGGGALFTLSQERAYTGRRSMKIVDAARSGPEASAELTGEPVPAAAGAYYRARAKVYIEDGSTDDSVLLLSFLDRAGQPVGRMASAPLRGADQRRWIDAQASGTAPPGTASVRVSLYSSAWNLMTGYVDAVSLQKTRRG
ncbi:hypothetical protein ABT282_36795 [Streptomyces sp. NPDC000927]|uniref:hypothetical protein n=1 Tax=Streptomyces sp. NPDC000927 TaxID=3154371 RepID=UPI003317165C